MSNSPYCLFCNFYLLAVDDEIQVISNSDLDDIHIDNLNSLQFGEYRQEGPCKAMSNLTPSGSSRSKELVLRTVS